MQDPLEHGSFEKKIVFSEFQLKCFAYNAALHTWILFCSYGAGRCRWRSSLIRPNYSCCLEELLT